MQQQLFTKDFIIKRIQDSGFPCWNLSITTGFRNNVNVQSYFGADWNDDDNEATKIEKSITRLENTLSTFPADTVFVIDIRAARNANGTSIIGPFQFTTAEQPAPEQPQQQTQQLGLIPSGYVPESMLKGLEEQLTKNFEAKFDALKAEHQQQQREIEFNNRLERLQEREQEVKELEKAYKSDVAKGADVVVEIVKKIGAYFLMPKGAAHDAQIISQQQLGAMQQQQPQQQDPKETKVDEICTLLYNNYSIEQLNELQKQLQNGNMGEQTAATTSSTATAI